MRSLKRSAPSHLILTSFFFFSSRRRHTRLQGDWSSDVCSSDLEGLLYAGTDDGNLQISQDGARSWKNLTGRVKGVPDRTCVSRVVPSRYAEGTDRKSVV